METSMAHTKYRKRMPRFTHKIAILLLCRDWKGETGQVETLCRGLGDLDQAELLLVGKRCHKINDLLGKRQEDATLPRNLNAIMLAIKFPHRHFEGHSDRRT